MYTEKYFIYDICFSRGHQGKELCSMFEWSKAEMIEQIQKWASESCDIWNLGPEVTMKICVQQECIEILERTWYGWPLSWHIYAFIFSISSPWSLLKENKVIGGKREGGRKGRREKKRERDWFLSRNYKHPWCPNIQFARKRKSQVSCSMPSSQIIGWLGKFFTSQPLALA